MCGIAGVYIKDFDHHKMPTHPEMERFVNELLKGIEGRGRDATGLVSIADGARTGSLEKTALSASRFVKWRRPLVERPRVVMLHTRFTTKGSESNDANNHPVQYDTCFATHNGHISNDDSLFEKYKLTRHAEVDTEIIPALFSKYGIDKAHLALQELDGNFAIAVADPERFPNALVLAKGPSSPLEYIETEQAIVWASTRSAMEDAWKETFGYKPGFSDFKSLKYGELLLAEGSAVETFDFEVYKRPATSSSSSWHGSQGHNHRDMRWWEGADDEGYGYVTCKLTSEERKELCICGMTRFMHAGPEYKGKCYSSDEPCDYFIPKIVHSQGGPGRRSHDITVRDREAGETFTQREFTIIEGGKHIIYVNCAHCERGVNKEDTLEVCGFRVCKNCDAPVDEQDVTPIVPVIIGDQDQVLGEDDDEDDEEIDEVTLATAAELGLYPEFVDWILFKAEDADFDREPSLINSYVVCDDTWNKHRQVIWPDRADVEDTDCGVRAFAEEMD